MFILMCHNYAEPMSIKQNIIIIIVIIVMNSDNVNQKSNLVDRFF